MELKSHSCWPNIAAVTMFLFLVGLIMSCSDSDSDSDNEANNEANNSSEGDCVTDEDCQANFDGHPQIENINKFTCRTDGQGIRFCSECESSDECESGVCTGKTFCGLPDDEGDGDSEGDCVTDEDCQANFDGHPQIENINKFTCRTDGQGIRFCSECESSDECESGVCTGKTFCGLLD